MADAAFRRLLESAIEAVIARQRPLRSGEVVAVSTGGVDVRMGFDAADVLTGVPYTVGYAPRVGDVVNVLVLGGSQIVLGIRIP